MRIIKRAKLKKRLTPIHDIFFELIHSHRLIYNTCWEDPRIDKKLLDFNADSKVVMITSAGCNALDYLLKGPDSIHTVDVNPRQNALLELKIALVELGSYDNFFQMFGLGHHNRFEDIYHAAVPYMSVYAIEFWKRNIKYFDRRRPKKSFYYYGTSGDVAWFFLKYLYAFHKKMKCRVSHLLNAQTLQEQKDIYATIEPVLWNRFSKWLIRQPGLMTMLGVPRPQVNLIRKTYPDGLCGFVSDKLRHVFTEIPISDNYFWRVYVRGEYSPSCCPNYLKVENFETLRKNIHRIKTYTNTVTEFLKNNPEQYSHFILLDHQDWLAWQDPESLSEEWKQILKNSYPGTKILLRSAGADMSFLPESITSGLTFFPSVTKKIHTTDRVGTYGSLHLAVV